MFAESVLDQGFPQTGPFAAASALLLRRPPRRHIGTGEQLRRVGEPTLESAKRLCSELDYGVLPIQGPPGSGKTFTGARAI
ncbi:hypothetical protein, partial [Salmonella sp. SAL4360]|uniref:hypothetical protein n=1 Tax=Salmonella sp. SAL4360 TaxID=3159881 RepID=UPI00397DD832